MIKWLKCLFLGHEWKWKTLENYYDLSYCSPGEKGIASHHGMKKCSRCGKDKFVLFYMGGHVDIEKELNDEKNKT